MCIQQEPGGHREHIYPTQIFLKDQKCRFCDEQKKLMALLIFNFNIEAALIFYFYIYAL